jgi:hypothetical protein
MKSSLTVALLWVLSLFDSPIGRVEAMPKTESKLSGFTYHEILAQWVYSKYYNENLIVLTDINVEAKDIQFWAKVPQTEMGHFLKDVVIVHCKDKGEVQRLVENIHPNFAEAYGFSGGTLFTYNKEEYEK